MWYFGNILPSNQPKSRPEHRLDSVTLINALNVPVLRCREQSPETVWLTNLNLISDDSSRSRGCFEIVYDLIVSLCYCERSRTKIIFPGRALCISGQVPKRAGMRVDLGRAKTGLFSHSRFFPLRSYVHSLCSTNGNKDRERDIECSSGPVDPVLGL